ncbi:MAG: HAD-IC family P-type ATPase [Candidatus Pacebacteria bacterium]|nr:HAD-IC family P-type ATPase [Candidatus Paceibacterota bacterium]
MFAGLTTEKVQALHKAHGANALPTPKYRFLILVARQFKGFFNILLLVAATVTWLLGEPIDAGFMLLFVILSVALSLYQEYKSNSAADTLKSYLVHTITVMRDGREVEVSTAELVPGDILVLESGDIIPADAVLKFTHGLTVNETTFTGESLPVVKKVGQGSEVAEENILYQGVNVISGMAYAEVTAIGANTRLAKISAMASVTSSESQLNKGIDRISNFILRTTLITLLFVVLANIFIEGSDADVPHLLIFAIALAVSVIPEALPLVITFSLSRGALLLAKRQVIVKRLSSVQDLGSIELLCTDKTGTITENHLSYKNNYLINDSVFHPLVLSRLAAHDLNERNPEPFDLASDQALSEDQRSEVATYQLIEEESFDPDLRSNGAVVRRSDGLTLHIRRGSPEYFFERNLVDQELVAGWLQDEENQGRRVLGVSYDDGSGERFGGFVSFADTLKTTTASVIKSAREMNVAITIITGDSLRVAEAVGRETGLVHEVGEVMEAKEFFALSPVEQHKLVGKIRVFARSTPEQKLSLIELLKEKYTVGFLGEGINDAPALKSAHVSMVVQSASDVARETADIILLKPDLRVIIEGIKMGRETHANTLKYIRTTLVANFGNFYAVAMGSLFITFLPMLPKQILLLNLLSDFPMMAIAFDKVSKLEIKKPQNYDFKSLYIIFITLGLVSTIFDFMWFALFYKMSPEILQTNWFIASVITEILLLFSIRSMLPLEKAGWPAKPIIVLSAVAFVLALALPMIPVTAEFFGFTPPTLTHFMIIISLAVIYLITTEITKRILVKFLKNQPA